MMLHFNQVMRLPLWDWPLAVGLPHLENHNMVCPESSHDLNWSHVILQQHSPSTLQAVLSAGRSSQP